MRDIRAVMGEVAVQEGTWSYAKAEEDFTGGEQNFWFERDEGTLRRSFSVWRFFGISDRSVSVMWRLAVALGFGPIEESYPFLTWSSPREYEIYSYRMDPEGLELSFSQCDSPEDVKMAVDRFMRYRRAHFAEMLADCWRGLGSVIEGNGYLPKFRRLNREAVLLPMVASGDLETVALLRRFVTAVDLGWASMRIVSADESGQLRDLCGVAALKFFYDRRDVSNTSDALVAYKLGAVWFDNRSVLDELDAEMVAVIQSAK